MLSEKNGFIKWVILALILSLALALLLGWPRYQKSKTLSMAKKALERGKEIAYQREFFRHRYGMYMPDLSRLEISFICDTVPNTGNLACDEYVYEMESALLRVRHQTRSSWFEIHIAEGWVDCAHTEKIVQESRLCNPGKMPELL
jgi:hypothetical protein